MLFRIPRIISAPVEIGKAGKSALIIKYTLRQNKINFSTSANLLRHKNKRYRLGQLMFLCVLKFLFRNNIFFKC
jgi:hypothetical protein